MKKELNYLSAFIILSSLTLLGAASCDLKKHSPPNVEECVLGDQGCICIDERIDNEVYLLPYKYNSEIDYKFRLITRADGSVIECLNHMATSPADKNLLEKWVRSKIKKLMKLERKKCK